MGKGGRERERHTDVCLPACPQPGTWPATQACVLTGNPSVCRMTPYPLGHTNQGTKIFKIPAVWQPIKLATLSKVGI